MATTPWVYEPDYTRSLLQRRIAAAAPWDDDPAVLIARLEEWDAAWAALKPGDPQPVGLGAMNPGAVAAS